MSNRIIVVERDDALIENLVKAILTQFPKAKDETKGNLLADDLVVFTSDGVMDGKTYILTNALHGDRVLEDMRLFAKGYMAADEVFMRGRRTK